MDNKKTKSILQTHSSSKEEDVTSNLRQKRVSFCGKKSVREFEDHHWLSYEVSDRVESSTSSETKSNTLPQSSNATSNSLLCTTSEYINKTEHGSFNLEVSADITLTQNEKKRLENEFLKKTSAESSCLNLFAKATEIHKSQQKAHLERAKLLLFNENSNKENIEPHSAPLVAAENTKMNPVDDTPKIFDNTLAGKSLLSDSDENFETRSFHHDLQRISEHVAPTDTSLCAPVDQGEDAPSCSKETYPTIEEHHHKTYPKSPKVIVRHITTPMKLTKSVVPAQSLEKAQKQSLPPQQQQQLKIKSSIHDAFSDVSGLSPMDDSSLTFRIGSSAEASPLVDPAYKKVDLQTLNSDCQSGKIQLFSNRKSRPNTGVFRSKILPKNIEAAKPDINMEVENIFWNAGNSGPSAFESKTNKEHTPRRTLLFLDDSIDAENNGQKNMLGPSNIEVENIQNTNNCDILKSEEIETELPPVNKETNSKGQTILFQDMMIDEETNVSNKQRLRSHLPATKTDVGMEVDDSFCNDHEGQSETVASNNGKGRTVFLHESIVAEESNNASTINPEIINSKALQTQITRNNENSSKMQTFICQDSIIDEATNVQTMEKPILRSAQFSNNENLCSKVEETALLDNKDNSLLKRQTIICQDSIIMDDATNVQTIKIPNLRCAQFSNNKNLCPKVEETCLLGNKDNILKRQTIICQDSIINEETNTENVEKPNLYSAKLANNENAELFENIKKPLRSETILFQGNTIVDETAVTKYVEGVSKSIYERIDCKNMETAAAAATTLPDKQILTDKGHDQKLTTNKINEATCLNMSLQIEKTMLTENAGIETHTNVQPLNFYDEDVNVNHHRNRRGTIFFEGEEIAAETEENLQKSRNDNRFHFNMGNEIEITEEKCKNEAEIQHLEPESDNRRKTCYFNESILVEEDEMNESTPKNVEAASSNPPPFIFSHGNQTLIGDQNSQPTVANRRTLYFENSGIMNETNLSTANTGNVQIMQTKQIVESLGTEANQTETPEARKSFPLVETYMELVASRDATKDAINATESVSDEAALINDDGQLEEGAVGPILPVSYNKSEAEMDVSFGAGDKLAEDAIVEKNAPNQNRFIQLFDADEPMEVDDLAFKMPSSTTVLKGATKKTPRKSVHFSENVDFRDKFITPRTSLKNAMISKCSNFSTYSPQTPHRSLLEFENLENEVKNTSCSFKASMEKNSFNEEPVAVVQRSLKRDTANLTPNLPVSKKRHSLHRSRLEFSEIELNTPEDDVSNKTTTLKTTMQIKKETANFGTDDSMPDAIDRTEPPCFFENITPCTDSLLEVSKASPTSRLTPLYTGAVKKMPQRFSLNMQSLAHLDILDTIDEGRFQPSIESNDNTRKSAFEIEDKPITISDVSQHYLSLKQKEPLSDNTVSDIKGQHKSFSDKISSVVKEFRQLLDISKDPEKLEEYALAEWELEDSQKVNVSPIITEQPSDVVDRNESNEAKVNGSIFNFNAKSAISEIEAEADKMSRAECFKQKALVCRKCVRCQDSIINETISTEGSDSFVAPTVSSSSGLRLLESLSAKLDANRKRRDKLLQETLKLIQEEKLERLQKELEITETVASESETDDEDEDYGNPVIRQYNATKKRMEQLLENMSRGLIGNSYLSFVDKLENLMKQPTAANWLINFCWRADRILRFRHRICLGFIIVLHYEETKRFGVEVSIKSITFHETTIDNSTPLPISYIRLYQIKLQLYSNDLSPFCDGNTAEDVFRMLEKINTICMEAKELSDDLWNIVCKHRAVLIRENNRNFVRKIGRKIVYQDGVYHRTDSTEFRIEVTNIRKLDYKNIITPSLYLLNEDIVHLPQGVDFLKHFLKDPMSYLRNNNESV